MNILDLERTFKEKGYVLKMTMLFGTPPVIVMRFFDEETANKRLPDINKELPPEYGAKVVTLGASASIFIYQTAAKAN